MYINPHGMLVFSVLEGKYKMFIVILIIILERQKNLYRVDEIDLVEK